ncbi:MAG: trypsin-like peptidase domain-containing protein [Lachnospiraceae bacterium]|nr:trypsin-like peptidase domain-containing protein [Lachnospiraceae bacterium]
MKNTPYAFALYSDEDYEAVDDIFLTLYKHNLPIKSPGDFPPDELRNGIGNSKVVLLILSDTPLDNPAKELLNEAIANRVPIIPYLLTEEAISAISPELRRKSLSSIRAYEYAEPSALAAKTEQILRRYITIKEKKPMRTASIALAIMALIAISVILNTKNADRKRIEHLRQATVQVMAYNKGEEYMSTGSGFFIDDKGHIATNYHVIDGKEHYYIALTDTGRQKTAEVVTYNTEYDIAILRVSTDSSQPFLTLADTAPEIGDTVYDAGYPKSIDLVISKGVISNTEFRDVNSKIPYYIMTCPATSGNSGGPVVNKKGEVIGIATAKVFGTENFNLVRPVKYLKRVIDE